MFWESIQFSAGIVMPSFVIIFLGRLITLKNLMASEQMDRIGKLTFSYLLSTKIFLEIADSGFGPPSGGGLVPFCLLATTAVFLLTWALARRLMHQAASVGAFVQACFRCSFTVLGLSMIETFAGKEGVARAVPLLAATVILFNILACIVLVKPGGSTGGAFQNTLKSIISNPLILAVAAGLAVALSGITLPHLIRQPMEHLGSMAVPLSLLCIGASLNTAGIRRSLRYAMAAAVVKTFGAALVFLPVAALSGFRGYELTVIAIYLTAANPSANYVMALATDNDSDLAASAVVISTVLSVPASVAAIAALRLLGLV